MTLIVTPGDPNADSYASVATCVAYALAKGLTFPDPSSDPAALLLAEQALRRATTWLDGNYRYMFAGQRVNYRAQPLEWPRYGIIDAGGYYVPYNTIPIEVVQATCEVAVRELANPNGMAPDLDRGGAIRRIAAGSVNIEYATTAPVNTTFPLIDFILGSLLNETANQYSSVATR